jgi:hypothetical protein
MPILLKILKNAGLLVAFSVHLMNYCFDALSITITQLAKRAAFLPALFLLAWLLKETKFMIHKRRFHNMAL